jgi:hypothetical protein
MEDFRKKYYRLKFLLVELSSKIDKLTEEQDFFSKLGIIRSEINEVLILKNDLQKHPYRDEYHKIEPELNSLSKQIHEKFDYIIEQKRRDLNEVLINIKNLENSRKLANYQR